MYINIILAGIALLALITAGYCFWHNRHLKRGLKKPEQDMNSQFREIIHELRTPVSSIKMLIELMQKPGFRKNEKEYNEYVQMISESAVKMGQRLDEVSKKLQKSKKQE